MIHRNNYTVQQLIDMEDFIEKQKNIFLSDDDIENKLPSVESSQLNQMQLFVYKLVKHFIEEKKQLLMIVNGAGGTGKSFTICAVSKLLSKKVKRSAPTAKAAFLIRGETIHSQFRVHCNSKGETYIPLSGDQLKNLQQEFKGLKCLK